MDIAIIVVACLLLAGLIALFVTVQVMWHRTYPKTLPDGSPRPKQTFKEWCINHKPSKRRLIQVYAALLYNANIKGFISGDIYQSESTKYLCVPGLNCYSCPGAIGACPLGALQNALYASNRQAPYYMLGIIALFGLICARTICGFLCPVGLGQDLLYKIRTPKLKKSRVTYVLSFLKYVLLAVLVIAIPLVYAFQNMPLPGFCKYICPAGTLGGAVMLLINPNNAGTFTGLGPLFTWKFCVLVAIMVAAIFIYRVFCRFLCPLGAIYGFFNRIALLGVKLDKDNCTDCGLCISHCKMDVKRVGDHECINCGECISVCPSKAISWKGSKLFVHQNAVSTPPITERPIAAMAGADAQTSAPVPPAEGMNVTVVEPEVPAAEPAKVKVKKLKKRGKKFWLELTAWIAAGGLLLGALVYYNFVDVEKVGYEVGQIAPSFTLQLHGTDETFKHNKKKGEITVVDFWSSENAMFEDTLQLFNDLAVNYPKWNVIAVYKASDAGAVEYITEHNSEYSLQFGVDSAENEKSSAYLKLGGTDSWNQTVIINKEGRVAYNGKMAFLRYQQVADIAGMGYKVGDIAPDFTLNLIGKEGTYNLIEHRGKITIINFWATWCTPCKAELPYFNELAQKHPEWNVVAIHGTLTGEETPEDYVAQYYSDTSITFVQDKIVKSQCQTYLAFGGKGYWPMTVIVDEEGVVLYNSFDTQISFHSYAELEEAVLGSIAKNG